ncbi:type II toxin-antitoxin system VapC family toxin [uncultured Amnibacterium sp.]|uniref:type II toxin-antitoxin system VapC family toxin n=1 Tax=uncultured Amnibacterium sp. TaxID=1631851 RepID=UPI0035C9C372
MIVVDTSIWIDHLHATDAALSRRLEQRQVLLHPAVLGEISLGRIADRVAVLGALRRLARPRTASDDEVLGLIDAHGLSGSGIGWTDAHLLGSVLLTAGGTLWTRDRRLAAAAHRVGLTTEHD